MSEYSLEMARRPVACLHQLIDVVGECLGGLGVEPAPDDRPVAKQKLIDLHSVDNDDQAPRIDNLGCPRERGRLVRVGQVVHGLNRERDPVAQIGQDDRIRRGEVMAEKGDARPEAAESRTREVEHRSREIDPD